MLPCHVLGGPVVPGLWVCNMPVLWAATANIYVFSSSSRSTNPFCCSSFLAPQLVPTVPARTHVASACTRSTSGLVRARAPSSPALVYPVVAARAERREKVLLTQNPNVVEAQVAPAGDETRSIASFPRDTRRGRPTIEARCRVGAGTRSNPARIRASSPRSLTRMARTRGAKCSAGLLTVMDDKTKQDLIAIIRGQISRWPESTFDPSKIKKDVLKARILENGFVLSASLSLQSRTSPAERERNSVGPKTHHQSGMLRLYPRPTTRSGLQTATESPTASPSGTETCTEKKKYTDAPPICLRIRPGQRRRNGGWLGKAGLSGWPPGPTESSIDEECLCLSGYLSSPKRSSGAEDRARIMGEERIEVATIIARNILNQGYLRSAPTHEDGTTRLQIFLWREFRILYFIAFELFLMQDYYQVLPLDVPF
ncbi:hypothetical protein B0H11DRAFT_2199007 [Mycena galericulata]|nr:hypothetical protein B0H11DRAFT_2199007 [Mycena galericulata]